MEAGAAGGGASGLEIQGQVLDHLGPGSPGADDLSQVLVGYDGRDGPARQATLNRQRPAPQRVLEGAGMGVDDESVAKEPGPGPDQQRRDDWRIRHQDQRGTVRQQDLAGSYCLEDVLDRGEPGDFEPQVMDQ